MFRTAAHNLLIMIGVALPALLFGSVLFGALRHLSNGVPSLGLLFGGFEFFYLIWVLPALGLAILHQLVLIALPGAWSARTTRLAIVGTAVGLELAIVVCESPAANGAPVALTLALLPGAILYGLLARPLRNGGLGTN